jgi:signal transduction histidine kinase
MAYATPRMERRADGRLVAGVCRGLAEHLGVETVVIRLVFVFLAVASGFGVLAYLALWLLVPRADVAPGRRDWAQVTAYLALIAGLGLVAVAAGAIGPAVWSTAIGGVGGAILWQQADPERRQRWVRNTTASFGQVWLRTMLGVLLVAGGIIGFLAARDQLSQAREGLVATAVVLAGVSVILTPWLLRLWRDLDRERGERIRSEERAEVAAHIHDSVLHTLTLIQRNASDSREVQRLARAQERELRAWLYQPKADAETALAAAVRKVAAEVEDHHGVPIEVVCVSDCPLDERLGAMLQAAREAMVNAAKYAETPSVSVYAEVEGDEVMIFVRDRGKGFDLDAVPEDRMGVRESIIGRMERNQGLAEVRTAPGEGTEVRLKMKREARGM